jgi:hypothetical protein
MPGRGGLHYVPLLDYLATLPPELASARLPFAELERLLGRPLPLSARIMAWYWAGSLVARRNWQAAGWMARLDHARGAVTFTRLTPCASGEPAT